MALHLDHLILLHLHLCLLYLLPHYLESQVNHLFHHHQFLQLDEKELYLILLHPHQRKLLMNLKLLLLPQHHQNHNLDLLVHLSQHLVLLLWNHLHRLRVYVYFDIYYHFHHYFLEVDLLVVYFPNHLLNHYLHQMFHHHHQNHLVLLDHKLDLSVHNETNFHHRHLLM
jgi:hypothetical protein